MTMPSLGNLQPLHYDSDATETPRKLFANSKSKSDIMDGFQPSSPVNLSVSSVPSMPDGFFPNMPAHHVKSNPGGGVRPNIGRGDSTHSIEKRNARLAGTSSAIFEVEVPRTDGKLKIDIRSDEDIFGPGLFIYGCARGSKAEQQGLLQVGDELLAVNGRIVDGGTIEDLSQALLETNPVAPAVKLKLRRVNNRRHIADVSQVEYNKRIF
jgi:hypothetical protein